MSKFVVNTLFVFVAFLASFRQAMPQSQWEPSEGAELIGKKAPEFVGLTWVNSKPLTVSGLRGQAILVRFWLGDCSYCRNSISALNYLHETYSPKGLVVIGIHHPKGRTSLVVSDKVKTLMNQWGMSMDIPVALDNDWKTINRFWTGKDRDYTSSSFLIDRDGIIRWVHPGGTLALPRSLGGVEPSPAFESLQRAIEDLLSKK